MTSLAQSPIAVKGKKGFQKRVIIDGQEQPVEDNDIDLGFEIDPTKSYVFETLKKSDIPRIENLGSRAKAYDPTYKRYREFRYIGVAPTIFLEEQDDSYENYPDTPLSFYRNQITVKGSDKRLMEYMINHPLCEGSPFAFEGTPPMFKLVDKDTEDAIKARKHAKEQEAYKAVGDLEIDDLRPIARVVFGITETSEVAIRNAMYDLIKIEKKGSERMSNAEKVLDNLVNPRLLHRYNIQTAVDRGIINIDALKMQIVLAETNAVLYMIKAAKNADTILNELTNFSFEPDGEKFYNIIRQKL